MIRRLDDYSDKTRTTIALACLAFNLPLTLEAMDRIDKLTLYSTDTILGALRG